MKNKKDKEYKAFLESAASASDDKSGNDKKGGGGDRRRGTVTQVRSNAAQDVGYGTIVLEGEEGGGHTFIDPGFYQKFKDAKDRKEPFLIDFDDYEVVVELENGEELGLAIAVDLQEIRKQELCGEVIILDGYPTGFASGPRIGLIEYIDKSEGGKKHIHFFNDHDLDNNEPVVFDLKRIFNSEDGQVRELAVNVRLKK